MDLEEGLIKSSCASSVIAGHVFRLVGNNNIISDLSNNRKAPSQRARGGAVESPETAVAESLVSVPKTARIATLSSGGVEQKSRTP